MLPNIYLPNNFIAFCMSYLVSVKQFDELNHSGRHDRLLRTKVAFRSLLAVFVENQETSSAFIRDRSLTSRRRWVKIEIKWGQRTHLGRVQRTQRQKCSNLATSNRACDSPLRSVVSKSFEIGKLQLSREVLSFIISSKSVAWEEDGWQEPSTIINDIWHEDNISTY